MNPRTRTVARAYSDACAADVGAWLDACASLDESATEQRIADSVAYDVPLRTLANGRTLDPDELERLSRVYVRAYARELAVRVCVARAMASGATVRACGAHCCDCVRCATALRVRRARRDARASRAKAHRKATRQASRKRKPTAAERREAREWIRAVIGGWTDE